jgi:hypothetical protein
LKRWRGCRPGCSCCFSETVVLQGDGGCTRIRVEGSTEVTPDKEVQEDAAEQEVAECSGATGAQSSSQSLDLKKGPEGRRIEGGLTVLARGGGRSVCFRGWTGCGGRRRGRIDRRLLRICYTSMARGVLSGTETGTKREGGQAGTDPAIKALKG